MTAVMSAKTMVENFAAMGDRGHRALAERGEHFARRTPVKTVPAAAAWAKRERPRVKMCFMNAARFCFAHDDAMYFEGYWGGNVIPVWHAWVVLNGVVIDFTAEACDRKLNREGIKTDSSGSDYYGVHVPTGFVREHALKTKVWGDVLGAYLCDAPSVSD